MPWKHIHTKNVNIWQKRIFKNSEYLMKVNIWHKKLYWKHFFMSIPIHFIKTYILVYKLFLHYISLIYLFHDFTQLVYDIKALGVYYSGCESYCSMEYGTYSWKNLDYSSDLKMSEICSRTFPIRCTTYIMQCPRECKRFCLQG